MDDIAAGAIDAGVLWGPIGRLLRASRQPPLTVVPLLKEHGAPMDFRIAMGVRRSDQDWKRKLNRLIAENQDADRPDPRASTACRCWTSRASSLSPR